MEEGGFACGAGEGARAAAEVDDHPVGAEHDASHPPDQGGGDGVGGVDGDPAGGAAALVGQVGGVEARALPGGHGGELGLVDGLVDDDVDDRFGVLAAGMSASGAVEDRGQGIGATLGFGAFEHPGAGVVADPGAQLVPFGGELGVGEPVEHFLHRRVLGGADPGVQVPGVTHQGHARCPAGVSGLMVAVGTVGVGEPLPVPHRPHEHLMRMTPGQVHQFVDHRSELVATTRVGIRPG